MTDTLTREAYDMIGGQTVTRDSERDLGVVLFLTDAQEGRCFDCGVVAPLEFCHFTGRDGRAIVVGGVMVAPGAMGCRDCNDAHRAICSALGTPNTLPIGYVLARGGMPILPTRAELVRLARPVKAARKARIDAAVAEAMQYA